MNATLAREGGHHSLWAQIGEWLLVNKVTRTSRLLCIGLKQILIAVNVVMCRGRQLQATGSEGVGLVRGRGENRLAAGSHTCY